MAKPTDIIYTTPEQPRQLRIDSTSRCNAGCLSCHRFLSTRAGELPSELFNQILGDVSRWQIPLTEVIPVNYGELFMRKDWLWILEVLSQKLPKTQIVLPTNGSLLTEDIIKSLCGIPTLRIINFSLNAFFEETYEKFNLLKAENLVKIEKYMHLVKVLRPDITLWASMVFSPEYQSDLERDMFIKKWMGLAYPQILTASSAGRGTQVKILRSKPCRSIFSDIVIGYDGKLSSCCFDPAFSAFDLGFYSGDLRKDWSNTQFQEFRRLHNEGLRQEISLCRECTFE